MVGSQIDLDGLGQLEPFFGDAPGDLGPRAGSPGVVGLALVGEAARIDAIGLHGAALPGADAAVAAPPGAQVEIPDALDLVAEQPRRFVRHSAQHMAHVRAGKQVARALAKEKESKAKLEVAQGALNTVCTLLPGAAQLVGAPQGPQIGRKKKLEPRDLVLAVRALQLKQNDKVKLGIRLDRLQYAGAQLVLGRQEEGLQRALGALKVALDDQGEDLPTKTAHTTLTHMHDGGDNAPVYLAEHWIKAPQVATGTSAEALMPGVRGFRPKGSRFGDAEVMRGVMDCTTTFTYMPLCDKASGNLLVFRFWGDHWEKNLLNADGIGARVLFWPDVCPAHPPPRQTAG